MGRERARDRIAAARAAEKRRERRRWIITFAVTGVLVVLIAGGVFWTLRGRHAAQAAAAAGTGAPPWARPADTAARAKAAGLAVTTMEGTAVHFHTHLDVLVDGKPVTVPADLGIAGTGALAELHTHDTTGVLHVEAPAKGKEYTLGQLFQEWHVRLTATAIGGLRDGGGRTLTAYVDGKKTPGDPARIALAPHREIALVFGRPGTAKIPSRYRFPAGL